MFEICFERRVEEIPKKSIPKKSIPKSGEFIISNFTREKKRVH
jgi:hypothetical protein